MISIVIPLYNKEKSIRATLESIRAQSYTDWECIIVDDGSTDKSCEVAEQFKILDCRFKILSQPNSGVSAARNAGIMTAKGDYIAFLDADDLWTPCYLETLVALIDDYPDAGLYCIGYWVVTSPTMPSIEQVREKNKNAYRGQIDNPWIEDMDLYIGSTCSSKKRMIKIGLFDTRMTHGEDLDFCWRLMLDGGLVRDKKCCAFYRVDSENRAMHRVPPLDKLIVNYVDKYAEARAKNADFRRFFDEQIIYRLYPYMLSKQYQHEARKIAKQLDYSQLKWSMHFRMLFPRTYYIIRKYLSK